MAFTLNINVVNEFELDANFDQVFELLSDVTTALYHHPNTENVVDLGSERYRVDMKKLGTEKYNIHLTYTCDYHKDRNTGTVLWKPLKGEGNIWVDGSFSMKEMGSTVRVVMSVEIEIEMPLPKLLKGMVSSFIEAENVKASEQYAKNLMSAVGGGRYISSKSGF